MNNKYVGNLLISISVIVGFVFLVFGISASILAGKSILLSIQIVLGLLMFLGIAVLGSSIRDKKEKKYTDLPEIEIIKFATEDPEAIETPIEEIKEVSPIVKEKKPVSKKGLNDEEKKVIKFLKKAEENEMMQADLIKKVKVTKVKMTRILKKLEDKNLILKKRIGMNNIIVLK